jgi:hypothetical protein
MASLMHCHCRINCLVTLLSPTFSRGSGMEAAEGVEAEGFGTFMVFPEWQD